MLIVALIVVVSVVGVSEVRGQVYAYEEDFDDAYPGSGPYGYSHRICNFACPDVWSPVCGTDGYSYPTNCHVFVASCWKRMLGQKGVHFWYDGPCLLEGATGYDPAPGLKERERLERERKIAAGEEVPTLPPEDAIFINGQRYDPPYNPAPTDAPTSSPIDDDDEDYDDENENAVDDEDSDADIDDRDVNAETIAVTDSADEVEGITNELNALPHSETAPIAHTDVRTDLDSVRNAMTNVDVDPDAISDNEVRPDVDTEVENLPEVETQPDAFTDVDAQPDADAGVEELPNAVEDVRDAITEVDALPDANEVVESLPDAAEEVERVPAVEADPEAIAEVEADPDAIAEVEADPEAIAEVEADPDAITDAVTDEDGFTEVDYNFEDFGEEDWEEEGEEETEEDSWNAGGLEEESEEGGEWEEDEKGREDVLGGYEGGSIVEEAGEEEEENEGENAFGEYAGVGGGNHWEEELGGGGGGEWEEGIGGGEWEEDLKGWEEGIEDWDDGVYDTEGVLIEEDSPFGSLNRRRRRRSVPLLAQTRPRRRLLRRRDADACEWACSSLPAPVCGSDGVTRLNACRLEREKCRGKEEGKELVVRHGGECRKLLDAADPHVAACLARCGGTAAAPANDPTLYPLPVCASDGKTYPNFCLLLRTKCLKSLMGEKEVRFVRAGFCGDSKRY